MNIFSINEILDHNEITLHFLQVAALSMPQVFRLSRIINDFQPAVALVGVDGLHPLQKAILDIYMKCTVPQGLHYASVVRSLSDKYPAEDIRQTITWLISEGYIFETHDSDHARIVSG